MKNQLQRATSFVKRHNEAVVVAVLATLAFTQQHRLYKSQIEVANWKTFAEELCDV